jgi:hypothetical protein
LLEKIFPVPTSPAAWITPAYQLQLTQVYQHRQQVMAGILLVHALAIWVLTTREPRTPRLSRRQLGIWIARLGSFGPAAGLGLSVVPTLAGSNLIHLNLLVLFIAFYVPVPTLLFLHLRRLSARIGRPRLAEHAGIVGIGLSICFAAFVAMIFLTLPDRFGTAVAILPVACFILGYFWALFLLLRLTVAFARAVGEARATWTQFDAAANTATSAGRP